MTEKVYDALRAALISYMRVKLDQADWHAVRDVAVDLEILEAQWKVKNG
jgi:hypothetical protein